MRNYIIGGPNLYIAEMDIDSSPKVWGEEHLLYNKRGYYCVKIMTLKPGYQCSMHWHSNKNETFILQKGKLTIEIITQEGNPDSINLTEAGDSITLEPNTPHTFYCPDEQEEETVFIEASTYDESTDSYRVYPSKKRKPITDR